MPPQAADQHGPSLDDLCTELAAKRHIIVASNRGPVTFADADGKSASAGAVSAGSLSGLQGKFPLTWVSVAASPADRRVSEQSPDGLITRGLPDGWAARFVAPSRREFHRFYNIICNPLLWFLHHRSWGFTHTPNIDREAHAAWDRGMVRVSEMLADEIVAEAERAARPVAVLLRGYHTHLVAGMVREQLPDAVVHYVPEVPWPPSADWAMLPQKWRSAIFESLLACDVVGLTSRSDVSRLIEGIEYELPRQVAEVAGHTVISTERRQTQVRVFPPPIDSESIMAAIDAPRTRRLEGELADSSRHTFVTAERSEPHKNLIRSVRAYGALLAESPELAASTRYVMVIAPVSQHLAQYRRYLQQLRQEVKDLNHRYPVEKPVVLRVENDYLLALAAIRQADTVVSVPLADAQPSTVLTSPLISAREAGVIVSETSSAADVFHEGAHLVAPADVQGLAADMRHMIEMSAMERASDFSQLEAAAFELGSGASLEQQLGSVLTALDN